ncbi:MAG: outer membrane beta-barrel protein [Azoarcus sp.]|nr:outer membrane beta-barrel protein [Azoarcus sp.]
MTQVKSAPARAKSAFCSAYHGNGYFGLVIHDLLRSQSMRKQILAASIAAIAMSGAAFAHEPGEVILRAGAAHVAPNDSSSRIGTGLTGRLDGTKATVGDNTQLGLTGTFIVAPHFGIEILAATPFSHRVNIKGVDAALGGLGLPAGIGADGADGKFADVKHLPPTISAQYFFLNSKSKFQPYVGLGLNYTWFFDEHLTKRQKDNADGVSFSNLSLSNSWGWAAQAGADIALSDNLYLNAAIWRIDIKTKATANLTIKGVGTTKVKVDVDVDPWVYFFGVGYKF